MSQAMTRPLRVQAKHSPRVKAPGFTLIEVLVALLVMAFGLLSTTTLLLVTLRSNTSNVMKQQAVQSAYNAVERVRANRAVARASGYDVTNLVSTGRPDYPAAPGIDCRVATCSPTEVAAFDTWYWLTSDLARLPLGSGSIATQVSGSNTLLIVTVQWDDSLAQNELGAATASPSGGPTITQLTVKTLL